jgi:hypothetical protein
MQSLTVRKATGDEVTLKVLPPTFSGLSTDREDQKRDL